MNHDREAVERRESEPSTRVFHGTDAKGLHGVLCRGSLAEAGDLEAGVEWERRGSTGWILTGVEGGLKLKLTDGMSVDSFLGNSIGTIRRR